MTSHKSVVKDLLATLQEALRKSITLMKKPLTLQALGKYIVYGYYQV